MLHTRQNFTVNRFPTLYDHLVAGHEDLLPVAGLGVLQDGGTRLGCGSVGHGQRLQALHSICAVIGQLDGAALSDGDCGGTRSRVRISPQHGHIVKEILRVATTRRFLCLEVLTVLAAAGLIDGSGHGDCGDGWS